MTDLGSIFERLGLDQYLNAFLGEGFDTWETVLDIQESDLDALNVKLGHRRKLQREIANYRGISYERLVGSPAHEGSLDVVRSTEGTHTPTAAIERGGQSGETKRKYRRHPKPDESAPDRPPSAYVIFSNKVREDVKGENLTFTAIAKLVGDRWQKLDSAEKEPFEAQAAAAKERYLIQLSAYKKTDKYKEYLVYLAEFKAKHGQGSADSKRPKLDPTSSGGSLSVKSGDTTESLNNPSVTSHARVGSVGSTGSSSFAQALPSPAGGQPPALITAVSNSSFGPASSRLTSASPQMVSPHATLGQWDTVSRAPQSSRSSISDESTVARSDHQDPVQRTAQLSIVDTPTGAPSFSPFASAELVIGTDLHRRSTRSVYGQQQDSSSTLQSRVLPGSISSLTPPGMSEEYWRVRPQHPASAAASRAYSDFRTLHQPVPSGPNVATGTMPRPPLMPTERFLEPSPGQIHQSHRTLPPLAASQQGSRQHSFRSSSQSTSASGPQAGDIGLTRPWAPEGSSPPLDSSESAAINTLAGLASTNNRPDSAKPPH